MMEVLLVGQVRHKDNDVEPLIVYLPASHDKQVVSAVAAEVADSVRPGNTDRARPTC